MDLPLTFAIGVLTLRLGLLFAGVAFCWMGYRLFAHARETSAAEVSIKDLLKLNLQRIGPGVFFSLFGAAILIYSVHNGPQLRWDNGTAAPEVGVPRTGAIAGAREKTSVAADRAALSRAANQIALINRIARAKHVSDRDHEEIVRMSRDIRLSLMRSIWQEDWGDYADFEAWLRNPDRHRPNASALQFFERG